MAESMKFWRYIFLIILRNVNVKIPKYILIDWLNKQTFCKLISYIGCTVTPFHCREEFLSHCQDEAGTDEDKGSALFSVFDDDASGTMDFPEFLMASNALKLRLVQPMGNGELNRISALRMTGWIGYLMFTTKTAVERLILRCQNCNIEFIGVYVSLHCGEWG